MDKKGCKMFKKIKDKWNKLDERTKKAVKAVVAITACVNSMYLGADITKAWYNYKEKHKFDDYQRMMLTFDKDKDLGEYFLILGRHNKYDDTKRMDVAGCLLGTADKTREILKSWSDHIAKTEADKESVNEGLSECLDLITEMEKKKNANKI